MQSLGGSRALRIVVMVCTGLPLLLLCVQSVFLRWYADDFLYAAVLRTDGFLGAQASWYNGWSGRFSYTAVATALLELGPAFAGAIAILTTLALVWVLARPLGLPVAVAATYALLFGTPDFQQTSFWFTGMLTYIAPLIGLAWWAFSRLREEAAHPIDFLLPFLLSGFSEAGALSNIAFFGIASLFWRRRPSVLACIGSLAAFVIISAAPGNAVRLAEHQQRISQQVILETLRATRDYFEGSALSLGFPLLIVFAAAALFAPPSSMRAVLVALASTIAVALAVHGVAFIAMGHMPPGRVVVLPHAFLIAAAGVTGARMARSERVRLALSIILIVTCLAGPLVDSWNAASGLSEHRQRARAWDHLIENLKRFERRDVVVINVPPMVGTLKFITHHPDGVMNRAVAQYYGLQSIAASPPDVTGEPVDPRRVVRLRWTGPQG